MSSELAIEVRGVSKVYRIYERPEDRLIQMATLGRRRTYKEFAALHEISLTINRGETIGIIGRNGCGKSTLLQIICGTLQPSEGHVAVTGRIAALLELGAGFNGEFTGRENVYMNGAILGFSRQDMDDRFEDIAQFAAIGDFIEHPVKTYSSGMFVRLAFAVAISVEPDILIIDEALAVGDEAFQRKCFARIEAIKERGGTILFVSHGAQTIVQLCDRVVLLDAGEKLLEGEPKLIVAQYQRLIYTGASDVENVRNEIRNMQELASAPIHEVIEAHVVEKQQAFRPRLERLDPALISESTVEYPENGAHIANISLLSTSGEPLNVLERGKRYVFQYEVAFSQAGANVTFGYMIKTLSGFEISGLGLIPELGHEPIAHVEAGSIWSVEFEWDCRLTPGVYFFNAGVGVVEGLTIDYSHRILDAYAFRVVDEKLTFSGIVDFSVKVSYKEMPKRSPAQTA